MVDDFFIQIFNKQRIVVCSAHTFGKAVHAAFDQHFYIRPDLFGI